LPGYLMFTCSREAHDKRTRQVCVEKARPFCSDHAFAETTRFHKVGSGESIVLVCYNREEIMQFSPISPAEEAALMAHEACHVWQLLCEWLNIELGSDKETDAYHIDGFTHALLSWLAEADAFQAASEEA